MNTSAATDPRPLTGEPMSVDLLNTVWVDAGGRHDLLDGLPGLETWLASAGRPEFLPGTHACRENLVAAREAIRAHLEGADPTASRVNEILARGWTIRRLGPDGPQQTAQVDDPDWRAAWTAVDDYLALLDRDPDRLRHCAHPDCVLYFYDVSPKANRRWCSMAGCGNRAKAARHYARAKDRSP